MSVNELFQILLLDEPSSIIRQREEEIFQLIPELKICKGFNQYSSWHQYDVYEHILHVIDKTDKDLELRVAALFHDIGKPESFYLDENSEGHFYGHWETSCNIFKAFALKYNLTPEFMNEVSNLIFYHDLSLKGISKEQFNFIKNSFSENGINKLYNLKYADLLAHSKEYHGLCDSLKEEHEKVLKRYLSKNNT